MTTTNAVTTSGVDDIDHLLYGRKWSGASLTIAFPTSEAELGYALDSSGFAGLSSGEKTDFKAILSRWAAVSGLTFTEVADAASADIAIYWHRAPGNLAAKVAAYPDGTPQGGDIQLGSGLTASDLGEAGSFTFFAALQAIGAALGLKTPSTAVNGFPAASDVYVADSVMSLFSHPGSGGAGYTIADGSYPTGPMLNDVAAIQHLYGVNANALTGNIGDTTYTFDPTAATIFQARVDGGGVDTFNFSSYATNLTVDLRAGHWTDLGGQYAVLDTGDASVKPPGNIVTPAAGGAQLIENANGGSGDDTLIGNAADNLLRGNGGVDVLKPGAGTDTLIGGAGGDTFDFSDGDGGRKVITDFSAGDTIKLRDVVAGGAISVGDGAALTSGQIAFGVDGANNVLRVGLDATPGADLTIVFTNGVGFDNLSLSGQTISYVADVVSPQVTSVAVPANGAYAAGQTLSFTVNFDEAVYLSGTPQLGLTIGSTTRQANYVSGAGTSALVFSYTIQAGETDANGITVGGLSLNGGVVQDGAGNAATLTLNNVGPTSAILVDSSAPAIASSAVPQAGTYSVGDHLDFTFTFDEAVAVTGSPHLALAIGTMVRYAEYVSGSGTNTLVFRHTVEAGDRDTNGITMGGLTLNGGTVKDLAGNAADLSFTGPSTADVNIATPAPVIVSTEGPSAGSYKAGAVLDFTVNFDQAVYLNGAPKLTLTLDAGRTVEATYVSGQGTSAYVFRYIVQAGDGDGDGVAPDTAVGLNGAALRGAGGEAMTVTGFSLADLANVKVDGVAPQVQSIARVGAAVSKATTQSFTVTFNEAVVGLDAGDFVLTKTGSATGTVTSVTGSGKTYTVNVGSVGGDGTLRLDMNAGSVMDAAGNIIGGGFTAGQTITIDNTPPAAPTIAVVAGDDTIGAGEVSGLTLSGTIEAGATVALTVGGVAKTAVVSGATWSYALTQADIDALGAGSKTIAVTATDALGNVSAVGSRTVTIDAGALTPAPQPDPDPPAPPTLSDIATRPTNDLIRLVLESLRIDADSPKTASLTVTLPDGSTAPSTAARVQADVNAAIAAFKAGLIGQAVFEERLTQAVAPTTGVAHDAYAFFTGSAPTRAGMTWLIDSPDNPNDLTDGYYARFSVENRYINFAVNLGKFGEGRAAFESKYGGLTFADAVAKAYGEIIGVAEAQGAGVDVPAALRYIQAQEAYFRAVGGDDLGAKAAMAGFILSVGESFHVGKSYEALEDYVVASIVGAASASPAWDLG